MTFQDFLQTNNLPPLGTILTTTTGTKAALVRYEFEANEEWVVVECKNDIEIYWSFSQVAQCSWQEKDNKEEILPNFENEIIKIWLVGLLEITNKTSLEELTVSEIETEINAVKGNIEDYRVRDDKHGIITCSEYLEVLEKLKENAK